MCVEDAGEWGAEKFVSACVGGVTVNSDELSDLTSFPNKIRDPHNAGILFWLGSWNFLGFCCMQMVTSTGFDLKRVLLVSYLQME